MHISTNVTAHLVFRLILQVCLGLCVSVTPANLLLGEETAQSDVTTDQSVWVTSIASVDTSGQMVAATAQGLLLRESNVVSFSAADAGTLTPIYSHPAAVWCVDVASDGKTVASVDYRGNLVLFDWDAKQAETHEGAFQRWCQAMIIAPDDQHIVAGNEAGKVMVWDIAAGKVAKSIEVGPNAVTGLAFSPDAKQLAASDGDGKVHLLTWPDLESAGQIQVSDEPAWCVAFIDDGKRLLVGSADRHLYQCPAKADAKAESVVKGTDWITQVVVSDSGTVAAAEVSGRVHFPGRAVSPSMKAISGVWALCFVDDSQLMVGTRKNGILIASRSWNWSTPAGGSDDE